VTDDAVTRVPAPTRPLRHRLAWMLTAAGGVLALSIIVIVISLVQLALTRRSLVDYIDPAALAAQELRTALVDQETGVRGYLLTRDRTFLAPYTSGREAERRSVEQLNQLAREEPAIAEALDAAVAAMERWHDDRIEQIIERVDRGDQDVSSEEFQETSRTRFDTARAALDRLDATLRAQRQDRSDALFATNGQVATAVAALAIALVVVTGLLFVALRRWVTDPLERLSREVREVAAGELDHPIKAEGSAELVSLATDIDAMRTRILNELARLRDATAEVERQAADLARSNADLEQFAYVASHDLQEPLRKVAGFCQLLQRRYGGQLDERADEYIHYAVDGAQRMQQLINDLLAFSRVGRTTERFEPVELAAAAERAVDNLGAAIEGSEASIVVGDGLPAVTGDPRLLTALFQNLIGNGIKFHRPDIPPRVEVRAETDPDADEVSVTVHDNGIGIDPQYGGQIFTLFKRLHTKTEYDGTGIGLALCKRIVEFHGGRISLEPSENGAHFRFTLPLHHQETING
jgi:signal transduction histidine kinase